MRLRILPVAIAFAFWVARSAHADAVADAKAKADALFKEGRELVKQGKWADACVKFEESQKIDYAAGTLINLGVCHARTGKNVKAYDELVESLSLAEKSKREDRVKICHDELALLEGKIARVTIEMTGTPIGLSVTIDDEPLPPAMIGIAKVVEPGIHTIKVSATGRKSWTATAALGAGDRKTVLVPELEVEASPAVVLPPQGTSEAGPNENDGQHVSSSSVGRHVPAGVYVLTGVGVAFVGATVFARIEVGSAHDERRTQCLAETTPTCDDAGTGKVRAWEAVSFVTGGLAAVSFGTAIYLYASAPKSEASSKIDAFVRVVPTTSGLRLEGAF